MSNRSSENFKPVLDQSRFPKKEKLNFETKYMVPLFSVLLIGVFGPITLSQIFSNKQKSDWLILGYTSFCTLLGAAGLFQRKYIKD